MNNTQAIFGHMISRLLSVTGNLPTSMSKILDDASIRLLDSEMIIEDSFKSLAELKQSSISQPLEKFDQLVFVDELIDEVQKNGLAGKFHQIIGLFGSVLLNLCASEAQQKLVEQWVRDKIFGHFLMTDTGGSSLHHWHSVLSQQNDGSFKLSISKKWIIEAQSLGFAMVVCRQANKPYPLTALVSPEKCQHLDSRKCGQAFLDGNLQLGNVSGEVSLHKSDLLLKGGLGAVNRFLTLVRPRFVLSLMNYLLWLGQSHRVTLTTEDQDVIHFISEICQWCSSQQSFSIHSVSRVLALKFASNEFLVKLVTNNQVKSINDQRDLLSFSKMEGSSYRCFYEIYAQVKRGRQ